MPLLVVALAPDDAARLTLAEWDALTARDRVLFEEPGHPLAERLRAAGVATGTLGEASWAAPGMGDGSSVSLSGEVEAWAVVIDPGSGLAVELARAGAEVAGGAAAGPDPVTAAYGAPVARRAGASLSEVAAVMGRLRSPDGCPWDNEQTHESLQVHLLEEAHEVIEAIDAGLLGTELKEELGDVLLQVFFHAQIAAADGRFDIAEVADALVAKLLHRHPHVFGNAVATSSDEVVRNWETIKAEERERRRRGQATPL